MKISWKEAAVVGAVGVVLGTVVHNIPIVRKAPMPLLAGALYTLGYLIAAHRPPAGYEALDFLQDKAAGAKRIVLDQLDFAPVPAPAAATAAPVAAQETK